MSELVQIDRREFVVRSSVGLAALLLAACQSGVDQPQLSGPVVVTISKYPQLANVNGIVRVTETATPVALARTSATTFAAYSLICPHQGGTIFVTGNASIPMQCPNHLAEFNVSGSNIGGQPTGSLHAYSAVFDSVAGTVTIS